MTVEMWVASHHYTVYVSVYASGRVVTIMTINAPFRPPRPAGQKTQVKRVPVRRSTMLRPLAVGQPFDAEDPEPELFVQEEVPFEPPSQEVPKISTDANKFPCQWRKRLTKKNKTWEGDGTITITELTEMKQVVLALRDGDGVVIARKTLHDPREGWNQGEMAIGNYEVEIEKAVEPAPEPKRRKIRTPAKTMVHRTSQVRETTVSVPPLTLDEDFREKCRPHQLEGIQFMYECVTGQRDFGGRGCILADEMGLGKTLQVIGLVLALMKTVSQAKVMIVCPVSLITNWAAEYKKWTGRKILVLSITELELHEQIKLFAKLSVYNVMLINYEKVISHAETLQNLKQLNLVVCDEGHRLKLTLTKIWGCLLLIECPQRIILLGTPIQNDLQEFYSLVEYVNPGILGVTREFNRQFIVPISQSREVGCMNPDIKERGEMALTELLRLTSQFMLRRTLSDVVRLLPSKTDTVLFVKPTTLQVEMFRRIISAPQRSQSNADALATINLLRKVCNSPKLVADDGLWKTLVPNFEMPLKITLGKITVLIAMLQEIHAAGEKVVLVLNFTLTLDMLALVVAKLNMEYIRLDGQTPAKMRGQLVKEFNSNHTLPIFLLSSKAGGVGLNLVGALRLVLFDNDWNPLVDLQLMARIHRDGQMKPCYIYRLLTTGSIDEKIYQRQLMKQNLSAAFVDLVKDTNNVFGQWDLRRLFDIDLSTNSNTHDLIECPCEAGSFDAPLALLTAQKSALAIGGILSASQLLELMEQVEKELVALVATALAEYDHINPRTQKVEKVLDEALIKVLTHPTFDAAVSFVLTKTTTQC